MSNVKQMGSRTTVIPRKGPGVWNITGLALEMDYVLAELANSALSALAERHHVDPNQIDTVSVEDARQLLYEHFRGDFKWIGSVEFPDHSFPGIPTPLKMDISFSRDGDHVWLSAGKFSRHYPERPIRTIMTTIIKKKRNEGIRQS